MQSIDYLNLEESLKNNFILHLKKHNFRYNTQTAEIKIYTKNLYF